MKKWSGGILIIALSCILLYRYSYNCIQEQPKPKQSAYDFFRNHPSNISQSRNISSSAKVSGVNVTEVHRPNVKPRLINVEGLSELYSSVNISKVEKKTFVVWPYLRSLLSRSDALPETAKGVKEASVAWRELLSIIEEQKIASNNGNANGTNGVKCPFAVSTFDKAVHSDGRLLELPCGLIEDSSITLIGIPNGKNRSFQIVLDGAGFSHEKKAPVILHYNVYLPEENSTKEPVIVQNSWTYEVGWGREQKCPRGRSKDAILGLAVDGLDSCNEHLVRSTMEEHQNVSNPIGDKRIDKSTVHAHVGGNFPFVEGSPFTATLWVGLEGFHMTVNGRHETSFKYRENLEPWLVNKVRVTGGVSIFSAIAKGLPASEDLDLIADVEQLTAPTLPKRRLALLVGIFSTGNNFERRMALRRSWMQYEAVRSGNVAVRFIIGFHKNSEVNLDLWKEAEAYGDIQLMPFVDYYSLISLKTIAICILGTKILPAKYIMKTDDDAFVRIDEVLSSLKDKPNDGLLYGLIAFQSSPHRDKESKWFVSNKEWPKDSYPPWAHGPGYVISRDIAKFIVQGCQDRDLKLFKLEDVAMGIWIEKFKESGRAVKYISDDRFYNAGCDLDYILAHYQSPRKVLCLWETLLKEQQPICCE